MKTRHLLTAIALPALFAACTNEDFVEQGISGNTTLDDRRMVDVPSLTMDFGEEAETRLALDGNKFVFQDPDKLGACLMDEITTNYQDPLKTWGEWFELVSYIQTNYKFDYNPANGNFENNALMCEGNYFFYFPYDPTMNTREAFTQDLTAEQVLKVNADGTLNPRQTVLDNQVFLGHSAIYGDREDHESLNVNMKGAFAYPAFRIAYSDSKPVTITKVAFKIVDNKSAVATEGEVTPFKTTLKVDPKGATFDADNQYVLAEGTKFYGMDPDGSTAEQISVSMPDNAACTLSNGKTLAGYVVIPAGIYDANSNAADANKSLWMYVYTDRGIVKTYLNVKNEEQDASGAPSDNVWTKGAYVDFQPDNGMLIDMGFSNEAISSPKEFRVSNTEDFETMLGWQAGQTVPTTVTATVVGKDIVLTKKIIDILNNNSKLTLNLTSDAEATVTVAADAPANALDRVNILDVNGSGNMITVVNKANLTVAADLDHSAGHYAYDAPSVLLNEGTLTFTAAVYSLSNTEIVNKGTITLAKKDLVLRAIGTRQFKNYGNMIVAADADVADVLNGGNSYGIDNYGTLTINEGIKLNGRVNNILVQYTSMGTINVNGEWNNAKSTNEGVIVVGETGKIVATSFENTNRKLKNAKGEVIAEAVINNSGNVNGVKNMGIIKMVTENARLQTATDSKGEIDNTVGSIYTGCQDAEIIFCKVTEPIKASELNTKVKKAYAERLDISGTITIDGSKEQTELNVDIAEIRAIGDLTITGENYKLNFVKPDNTAANLTIAKGETEISTLTEVRLGSQYSTVLGKVNIGEGGSLSIANNAVFRANKGTGVAKDNVNIYGGHWYVDNDVINEVTIP